MKLKTLEQFESSKPCKCGGNCSCGKSVNERFSFSKKEVEDAANLIASAISKADKVKTKVHHLEYDKGRGAGFDISIDGEESAGGSYVVRDNGDVVNAAIGNSHPNAVYNTIGNKDIADVFINMEKYESAVTEHHSENPNDHYYVKPCDGKDCEDAEMPWCVWEGDTLVKCFKTNAEAAAFAKEQNTAQGLNVTEDNIDEAKKYKFKDLAKAWSHVYGEDMEDEYEGFFQEVVGKYKNKVTKKDIANIWLDVYGEDIADDYDGFYNELQENLNQVAKLEELFSDEIDEANADGTISDDEDERRAELLERVKEQMQQLLASAEFDAKDIGGSFRSPGIMAEIKKELNNQLKKFR